MNEKERLAEIKKIPLKEEEKKRLEQERAAMIKQILNEKIPMKEEEKKRIERERAAEVKRLEEKQAAEKKRLELAEAGMKLPIVSIPKRLLCPEVTAAATKRLENAEHESETEKEVKKELIETISMLQEVIQAYDETYTPIFLDSLNLNNVSDLKDTINNLESIIRSYEEVTVKVIVVLK